MSFRECVEFVVENLGCALATIDDDQPRVRGMVPLWASLERADDPNFILFRVAHGEAHSGNGRTT